MCRFHDRINPPICLNKGITYYTKRRPTTRKKQQS
jgi:hypothetical protein